MTGSQRTKLTLAAAALAAAAVLSGCGDKPAASPSGETPTTPYAKEGAKPAPSKPGVPEPVFVDPHHGGPGEKPKGDGTSAPGTRAGRAAQPLDLSLPAAPALTAGSARALVDSALASFEKNPDATLVAIDYLSRLGDAEAVRKAAAPLLAKGEGTGGYEDPDYAGVALTALLRAGDTSAGAQLVALAEAFAAQGDVGDAVLGAAPLVSADEATRMKSLLARWAAQEDNFSPGETLEALAALRPTDAESLRICADIARDPEQHPGVRASALGVLLAANETQAKALGDAIATDAFESGTASDAIDGLAVRGLVEAIPYIRALVEKAIVEEAAGPEIRSAAFALVDIRGVGAGKPEDMTWLRSLLGKEAGIVDGDVRAALWALGDDAETGAAAAYLAEIAGGVKHSQDPTSGIDILEALALRGGAAKPPFDRVVSACAVVAPNSITPTSDITAQAMRLHLAAAYAFLAKN